MALVDELERRVQKLEGEMREATIRYDYVARQLTAVQGSMATSEQLENHAAATNSQFISNRENVNLRMDNLNDRLDPIQKALYWGVGIICGGVVMAVLALVLKG